MQELSPDVLRKMPLPRPEEGDKKARGKVLIIGGSAEVPGAALLAGTAALRAGAGRLRIATVARNATAMAIAVPEALVVGLPETDAGGIDPASIDRLLPLIEGSDCVAFGPGLTDQPAIDELAGALLRRLKPGPGLIFDARAIGSLRTHRSLIPPHAGRLIVTPHAGEMARLLGQERGEIEADPACAAREAATTLSTTVALKGARTFIVGRGEDCSVCREGNVGLATSGSGDVLAGVIAGLVARGAAPFVATCWGVYLHAKAGDRLAGRIGPLGFLAREILDEIPRLLAELS